MYVIRSNDWNVLCNSCCGDSWCMYVCAEGVGIGDNETRHPNNFIKVLDW